MTVYEMPVLVVTLSRVSVPLTVDIVTRPIPGIWNSFGAKLGTVDGAAVAGAVISVDGGVTSSWGSRTDALTARAAPPVARIAPMERAVVRGAFMSCTVGDPV